MAHAVKSLPEFIDDSLAGWPRTRYEIIWYLQQAGKGASMQMTRGALRTFIGDSAADFDEALQWTVQAGLVRQTLTVGKGDDGWAYEITALGGIVATAYRSGMVAGGKTRD
jgi:hypothetical protein